jgi:hypothetical protein
MDGSVMKEPALPPRPFLKMAGSVPKVHDFGSYGRMTVLEASVLSGRHDTTIYRRLKRGVTGDALLQKYLAEPPPVAERKRPDLKFTTDVNIMFYQGVWMHQTYGKTPPTVKQLVDLGYHRATAYRRIRAYKDALSLP